MATKASAFVVYVIEGRRKELARDWEACDIESLGIRQTESLKTHNQEVRQIKNLILQEQFWLQNLYT